MTDQIPPLERLTEVEARQQRQEQVVAQIHEILLVVAQSHRESAIRLDQIEQQQAANAQQIAGNAQAIAELQAILRERYNGNGQTG